MSKIKLIDERRYLELKKEKIKPEDRRFILMINHNEVLFNENMLLQNRILLIALFALFIALLSFIFNLEISILAKSIFIIILTIFSLFLISMFNNAIKRVKIQNNKIKANYDGLFKSHFNYVINGAKNDQPKHFYT